MLWKIKYLSTCWIVSNKTQLYSIRLSWLVSKICNLFQFTIMHPKPKNSYNHWLLIYTFIKLGDNRTNNDGDTRIPKWNSTQKHISLSASMPSGLNRSNSTEFKGRFVRKSQFGLTQTHRQQTDCSTDSLKLSVEIRSLPIRTVNSAIVARALKTAGHTPVGVCACDSMSVCKWTRRDNWITVARRAACDRIRVCVCGRRSVSLADFDPLHLVVSTRKSPEQVWR